MDVVDYVVEFAGRGAQDEGGGDFCGGGHFENEIGVERESGKSGRVGKVGFGGTIGRMGELEMEMEIVGSRGIDIERPEEEEDEEETSLDSEF